MLTFDKTEVRPAVAFTKDAIHLTGDLPSNAKTFTWKLLLIGILKELVVPRILLLQFSQRSIRLLFLLLT